MRYKRDGDIILISRNKNICSKVEIRSKGKGKAEFIRNKRRGLKLKVQINLSHTEGFCNYCSLNFKGCLHLCLEFERVTEIRKFWFERDDD